jgi:hypothetical protein
MGLEIESRRSGSPDIERVWRSSSFQVDRMTSVAIAHWDLVFWQHRGQVSVAVQGPESKAGPAPVPEDAMFVGIIFSPGASLSHLPVSRLADGSAGIPGATRRSSWLDGSAWRLPGYDTAGGFARRMAREGVLVCDPVVTAALGGAAPGVSGRAVQRRFAAATGLTRGAVRQAAVLIREGRPAPGGGRRPRGIDPPPQARWRGP